jgi:TonB family protein
VALLESMSDSIDSKRPAPSATASSPSKEYPWQPVSKPLSEPMASALKRAAEAANKAEPAPAAFPADSSKLRPAAYSTPSAHGAASAPAPARETPRPNPQMVQPHPAAAKISPSVLDEIEIAPAFGTGAAAADPGPEPLLFATMQDEPEASGSSKKVLIIAAIVVLVTAGAYFYATKHPEIAPASLQKYLGKPGVSAPVQTQAPASAQPQPLAAAQTAAASPSSSSSSSTSSLPTIVTPAGTSNHGSDAANFQVDPIETSPATIHAGQEVKPSAGKAASSPVADTEIASSTPAPSNRVLTVAKSKPLVKTAAPAPEVVVPPAPLSLGVGSSTDKEIAGIANGATAAMPKAATAGAVKISQGVTQGLLVKRVPPSYPQSAKQMHIQGTVQLQANIGKDGSVSNVKSLSGDPALAHAAIEAVKQWKYRPYTLNNEPVEIQTQITVNFKLP